MHPPDSLFRLNANPPGTGGAKTLRPAVLFHQRPGDRLLEPLPAPRRFSLDRVLPGIIYALLAAVLILALFSGCAALPPITGQACYTTRDGERMCVGAGAGGIAFTGEFGSTKGFAK